MTGSTVSYSLFDRVRKRARFSGLCIRALRPILTIQYIYCTLVKVQFHKILFKIAFILCFPFADWYLHVIEKYLSQNLTQRRDIGFLLKMSVLLLFEK